MALVRPYGYVEGAYRLQLPSSAPILFDFIEWRFRRREAKTELRMRGENRNKNSNVLAEAT